SNARIHKKSGWVSGGSHVKHFLLFPTSIDYFSADFLFQHCHDIAVKLIRRPVFTTQPKICSHKFKLSDTAFHPVAPLTRSTHTRLKLPLQVVGYQ
ncbi:MAG: hypothetical protein AB2637_11995, partial [Candidatus Thiodiazotropha sp.]